MSDSRNGMVRQAQKLLAEPPLRLTPPPCIAVAGPMNAGKSTFINALVWGDQPGKNGFVDHLPTHVNSCTQTPVYLRYGKTLRYLRRHESGEQELPAEEWRTLTTTLGDEVEMIVEAPQRFLLSLQFLDTPGFYDIHRPGTHDQTTIQQIRAADGVIWCVQAIAGLTKEDLLCLDRLTEGPQPIWVAMTLVDRFIFESDLKLVADKTLENLQRFGGRIKMIPLQELTLHEDPKRLRRWLHDHTGPQAIPTGVDAALRRLNSDSFSSQTASPHPSQHTKSRDCHVLGR